MLKKLSLEAKRCVSVYCYICLAADNATVGLL